MNRSSFVLTSKDALRLVKAAGDAYEAAGGAVETE